MHLSARQTEIVQRIATGQSDKEIAQQLGLSHATVRTHLQRLYLINGFHSRAEAVAAWLGRREEAPFSR
jgi:DNA-binding CsgD family transcriptional regulator